MSFGTGRGRLLVLFVLLTGGGALASARGATLTGSIRSDSDVLVMQVDVIVVRIPGDDVRRGVTSAADGSFRIESIPAGRYSVLATRIGYQSARDTVEVTEPTTAIDLVLVEAAILMEAVDVAGDRFAEDRKILTGFVDLDRKILRQIPAVGETDPLRSLQLLPGVQAASDFSSGLYIRGGGPDQTLVLLDGVPIYNPTHAFGFFSTFNADVVQGVSLYKSAYPARYGGRLGAVVDVRSLDPTADKVEGEVALGTVTTHFLLTGPAGREKQHGWFLGARRTFLEPFLAAARRADPNIPHYYFYDVNGGYRWSHPGGARTTATFYNGRDNLRFDLDTSTFVRLRWGNTALSLVHSRIMATRLLTRARFALSQYRSDSSIEFLTTPASFRNSVLDLTGGADVSWEATSNHRLIAGLEASRYRFEFDQVFNREPQIEYRKSPTDLSLYFQDDWESGGSRLQSGLRTRYFSDGDRYLLEPRASASTPLSEQVRLKLAGGLYHQYVQLVTTEGFSAADFYVPIDHTARPGRSYQGTLALDWEPSLDYQLTAETYYTALRDVVMFDNNAPGDESELTAEELFVTGGRGWASGLELFAQKRTGVLTGWLGYTLGWTRRTFPELNGGRSFPPKYDRRHDFNGVAAWRHGTWTYAASLTYGTGQAFTPASSLMAIRNPSEDTGQFEIIVLPGERNSARLLPYHRLDLSVSRDFSFFGRPATWMLQAFNFYSRRNEWFVQYNVERLTTEPQIFRMLPIIPSLGLRVHL